MKATDAIFVVIPLVMALLVTLLGPRLTRGLAVHEVPGETREETHRRATKVANILVWILAGATCVFGLFITHFG